MKKILEKFFIVIIAFMFIYFYIGICDEVFAASVSVSKSSVNVGESFSVSINIPSNATAAQGNITVEYADGTKDTGRIVFVDGMKDCDNSATFSAKSSGIAKISVSNIIISDDDGKEIENNASTSTSINVNSNSTQPPVASNNPTSTNPTQKPSPTPTPEPKQPNFKQVNDTIYATKEMNVRESWSTSSNKVGWLSKDQAVTRTGIGDNGWSRINYNGKTAYVSTGLITTTKPEEKPEEETPNEKPSDDKDEQKPTDEVEDNTENNSNIKTEEEIYQEIVNEIGTIPEVGNNINFYIFGIILFLSIGAIIFIFRKEA